MNFILNDKLKSFRFRRYTFLPKIPVNVTDDTDICDLLKNKNIKPVGCIVKRSEVVPFQEKKAKEGQLKIGALRVGGIGSPE